MTDAPAAAVFCGETCNGCKDDCEACMTLACGGCGACDHGRELALRGRAATASLVLHQIGTHRLEFGFNPNQLRGPDGRWIKMGGRGSAGKGGLPKGSGLKNPRVDASGTPAAPKADAPAERPGRAIAKRNYTNGDRVPLADGSTGTVVGGHHRVAGRPGLYVAVRPDGGGKLKEVAVDAIRKRQVREAEREGRPVTDEHGVAEGTRAAELRDAQDARVQASKAATPAERAAQLEANAEVMYGSDRSKWPDKVKRDLDLVKRRVASEERDRQASADQERRKQAAVEREQQAAAGRAEADAARARIAARAAEARAAAEAMSGGDTGPQPVGFTPRSDADWNLMQKRLGKRTARTEVDGDLQPGDIVPTKDSKWAEVLRRDTSKFWERNGLEGWTVRDDAKGYVHGSSAADIKKEIERYNAEKAWRDSGGSKDRLDGKATAPVQADGRRPGEPEIGPDGKYAKPTKQYAVHNGEVFTRTSRNPYRYASVVSFRDPSHPDAEGRHDKVWSWHRTAEAAQKGTLTGDQRRGLYVSKVIETGFEDPGGSQTAVDAPPSTVALTEPTPAVAAPTAAPSRAERDTYNSQIESEARMIRDSLIDDGTDSPFSGFMDKYKERELSDRLQELADANASGQSDKADRIAAQIRKLLLDTETRLEGELPSLPGRA